MGRSSADRRELTDLSVTGAWIIHAGDKGQRLGDPFVQICRPDNGGRIP
jgi:hypothetical protein